MNPHENKLLEVKAFIENGIEFFDTGYTELPPNRKQHDPSIMKAKKEAFQKVLEFINDINF